MKKYLILPLIACFINYSFTNISANKKEKHFGKVESIMGEYEGTIYIKLNEENDEMIEIELASKKEKSKGSKITTSSTITLNTLGIRSITIDNTVYEIRDIEYEFQKYRKRCCLKKQDTNGLVSLYSWGTKTEAENYLLLFKNYKEARILKMATTITTIVSFNGCTELKTKIRNKEAGYTIADDATNEERLTVWKKWIEESKSCVVKQ